MHPVLFAAAVAVAPLTAESRPVQPFAEITGSGVDIDGDILVRNGSATEMVLDEISVDVRDRQGRLVQRREINGNGTSPSILIVTDRTLPANGALLVFNPFPHFAPEVRPARLDYRLSFSAKGSDATEVVRVSVAPRAEGGTRFVFPVSGRTLIWDGHDFASHHRRWNYLHPVLEKAGFRSTAARYSLDVIVVDADGRRSTGDEARNENWLSFGRPVRAVAAGRVVASVGNEPDDRTFDVGRVAVPNAMYGNHLVVRHGDGSYSMYGHLQQGSVKVKAGQSVRAGEVIASIGASGSALFPHLHFQRMDGPTDRSEGVPTRFLGVTRPGGSDVVNGFVDSGDVLIAR